MAAPTTSPLMDQNYRESERHIDSTDHYLNQVSRANLWGGVPPPPGAPVNRIYRTDGKTKLFCCVNLYQIDTIDGANSQFQAKIRLYLMWQFDWSEFEQSHPALKKRYFPLASEKEYYSLSDKEIVDFRTHYELPRIKLFNAIRQEDESGEGIRLYNGVNGGAIMWNYANKATFKETFEFHNFPFDRQTLSIHLMQDNARNWDAFDLTITSVQFHYDAIDQPEFTMLEPTVERGSPKHKLTVCKLYVARKSAFYKLNVFAILAMLTLFSFFSFLVPMDSIGERLNLVLTLMLTEVAFKFATGSNVPKVAYSTHLDTYSFQSFFFLFFVAVITGAQSLVDDDGFAEMQGAYISAGVFVLLHVWWVISVYVSRGREDVPQDADPIEMIKGTNWYCYNFANPAFMLPKVEQAKF